MIFGIGTDIVNVGRMAASLARYGERFAARILHQDELEAFRTSALPAQYLAKRFAAKEAAAKALGTGFRDGLSLRHIAVGHDPLGRPLLQLNGRGRELFDHFGITRSHLSLADEREFAIAFVTLEQ